MSESLRGVGLSVAAFEVLDAIERHDDPRGMRLTDLVRLVRITSAGMRVRLERLATSGLVERDWDTGDYRNALFRLTAAGRSAAERGRIAATAGTDQFFESLGAEGREALDDLLQSMENGRASSPP